MQHCNNEEALKIGVSARATNRKLAIANDTMYAPKDEQGNITPSMDEIIKPGTTILYHAICINVRPRKPMNVHA